MTSYANEIEPKYSFVNSVQTPTPYFSPYLYISSDLFSLLFLSLHPSMV